MGKLAKLFLLLIFIATLGLPPVAVKVGDIMQEQEERISTLGAKLKDTEEKLRETEEEKRKLEIALKEEQERRQKTEEELRSTKAELKRTEDKLNSCIAERDRLKENIAKLQEEKAELEEKFAKQTKELNALKQLVSGKEEGMDLTAEGMLGADGKVIGIYGERFITLSLSDNIGGIIPVLFHHRRGKVIGKLGIKKLYKASAVMEADEDVLKNIAEGDLIELEGGERLLQSELFEGRIEKVLEYGFVSIKVDKVAHSYPVMLTYRQGKPIGEIKANNIESIVVVAELANVKPGIRIVPGDYLRAPR